VPIRRRGGIAEAVGMEAVETPNARASFCRVIPPRSMRSRRASPRAHRTRMSLATSRTSLIEGARYWTCPSFVYTLTPPRRREDRMSSNVLLRGSFQGVHSGDPRMGFSGLKRKWDGEPGMSVALMTFWPRLAALAPACGSHKGSAVVKASCPIGSTSVTQRTGTRVPPLKHVWLFVLENRSCGQIIGSPEAPLPQQARFHLWTRGTLLRPHPSQPARLPRHDRRLHDGLRPQMPTSPRWPEHCGPSPSRRALLGCIFRGTSQQGVQGEGTPTVT
jgi:hypothetical protein